MNTPTTSTFGPWHRWFAWHPIQTRNHGWRWLRVVERRRHYPDPMLPPLIGAQPGWEYRPTPGNRHEVGDTQNPTARARTRTQPNSRRHGTRPNRTTQRSN